MRRDGRNRIPDGSVVAPALTLTSLAMRRPDGFPYAIMGLYGRVIRIGTNLDGSGERFESLGMRVGTSRPGLPADQENLWRRES